METRVLRTESEYLITYRVEVFIDNEWQIVNTQHGTREYDDRMKKEAQETRELVSGFEYRY